VGIGVGYSKFLGNLFNPIIEIVRNMPPWHGYRFQYLFSFPADRFSLFLLVLFFP